MFIYREWDDFCSKLKDSKAQCLRAVDVLEYTNDITFYVLKHDVETNPSKALQLAKIEYKHALHGSYYVQAYLLKDNKKNIEYLRKIQALGHEVSYHYDVLDSNSGNYEKAALEFENNIRIFEKQGFLIKTVCQHGNPVVSRNGYSSNRDFFRNPKTLDRYPSMTDIVVDFKGRTNQEYLYISDAGYGWKVIDDPENNDLPNYSGNDIPLSGLDHILTFIKEGNSVIISTHPHRWEDNSNNAKAKLVIFAGTKFFAKLLIKIPFIKRFISRFYYLAKKI